MLNALEASEVAAASIVAAVKMEVLMSRTLTEGGGSTPTASVTRLRALEAVSAEK
jgi:hypothetical protein